MIVKLEFLRVGQWNVQLKAARKEAHKLTKKLELTEERYFQFGYDHAVKNLTTLVRIISFFWLIT